MSRALLSALLAAALLAGVLGAPATASAAPTYVSLEFDDGLADQQAGVDLLAQHGKHAPFYVNSGRPGKNRFLTFDQIQSMQEAGNEIGGHTIDHVDLTALGPDDQRRELCTDRADLLSLGFRVSNFAYPFGDRTPNVEAIAAECGYDSARITSGLRSLNSCQIGCPAAESLSPATRPSARRRPGILRGGARRAPQRPRRTHCRHAPAPPRPPARDRLHPRVRAGRQARPPLRFALYHRGSAPVRLLAYWLSRDGRSHYLSRSSLFGARAGWHRVSWVTPRYPRGAVGLSMGVSVERRGVALVDDVSSKRVR